MKGKTSKVHDAEFISMEHHSTAVGDLVIGSESSGIGFEPRRVYWLYDVPANAERGGHAHKQLEQIIVAVSGAFEVVLSDGKNERVTLLNQPTIGLKLPPGLWRELKGFSGGAICLVLASHEYDESDYIRQQKSFIRWKNEV